MRQMLHEMGGVHDKPAHAQDDGADHLGAAHAPVGVEAAIRAAIQTSLNASVGFGLLGVAPIGWQ
jgi:hypothetical protein